MNEFFKGFAILVAHFLALASSVLLLRKFVNLPKEVSRKLLHLILLSSLPVFLYAFDRWWISALAAISFALIVYPVLSLGERIKGYADLLVQRSNGEIKRSLLLVFAMFAALIAIGWGWLDDKLLVLICVFAWGFGDAAAALVGKHLGKIPLEGRLIEGRKSVEGTVAMFAVSFLTVLILLLIRGGLPWFAYLPIAFIAGAVSAVVELYTLKGFDTVTCPFAAAAVVIPLLYAFGGLIL